MDLWVLWSWVHSFLSLGPKIFFLRISRFFSRGLSGCGGGFFSVHLIRSRWRFGLGFMFLTDALPTPSPEVEVYFRSLVLVRMVLFI
ncbi:hypothetical protein BJ138DRAFT_488413 [Hygrophoropsis aurantiaca]|uniref:Uncharacterized protein n=1 Tax=Hygrophoropsis aurantiaca TaxID=72124 RepID=A0ACB8A255_9AGAM|nr:hypothetical protein BJ138DRAFT_488413 [Hygrophoropsis aurantiaca]